MVSLQLIYDAVAVDTIPATATVVMGYDVPDTLPRLRARFPNATVLTITTQGAPGYRLCDMETGDLTPAEAANWAYNELQGGTPKWRPPTIYCQAANGAAVQAALKALGLVMGLDVPWFMAWWNGVPNLVPPAPPWPHLPPPVGHQYFRQSEFTFDASVALASWVWPAPPAPPPQPKQGEDMFVRDPSTGEVCLCTPAGAVNLGNAWTSVEAAYAAANVPLVVVENAALQAAFRAIGYHAYTGP